MVDKKFVILSIACTSKHYKGTFKVYTRYKLKKAAYFKLKFQKRDRKNHDDKVAVARTDHNFKQSNDR
jgi:hypothetical protein